MSDITTISGQIILYIFAGYAGHNHIDFFVTQKLPRPITIYHEYHRHYLKKILFWLSPNLPIASVLHRLILGLVFVDPLCQYFEYQADRTALMFLQDPRIAIRVIII